MRVVVAGGSGFLGSALTGALVRDGHEVVVLTRRAVASPGAGVRHVTWAPDGAAGAWADTVSGAGAVINLAGDSIADGRWTASRKARLLDSRVRATRSLAAAIAGASPAPPVFVSGSAVGYYGACGDEIVTESHPPGADFLATVCVRWEQEAMLAASAATRVVCLRTGLVLDARGGALARMLLPFRLGVGGRLGSGRQYMPWIHTDDWVDLVRHLLVAGDAAGPVNATAPAPATNAEFTRVLGRVLRRPAFLPAPAFALRLALGEMAEGLLLSGQRAVPARAQQQGHRFAYADLDAALRHILAG